MESEDFSNLTGFVLTAIPGNVTFEPQDPTSINAVLTILYALVFLFGVTGNALVIFVIYRNPDMSTATNIFLVNLSMADLLVLLVCMPVGLIELYSKDEWLLGGFMCKFIAFLEIGVTNASIITMMAISFERYYAICRPLEVLYTCTKGRAMKIIIGVWMFSITLASPFFVITYTELSPFHDGTLKSVCRSTINTEWEHVYNLGIFVTFFLVPCIILMALYTCICRELLKSRPAMINSEATRSRKQKSTRNKNSSDSGTGKKNTTSGFGCQYAMQHTRAVQSRRQVIYMLITVIIFSFSCLMPFRIMSLWMVYSSNETKQQLGVEAILVIMHISRIMFYMNSAGNPILYNMMSTKFREASKRSIGVVCVGGKVIYNGNTHTLGTPSRHQSCRRSECTTKADTLEYESLAQVGSIDIAPKTKGSSV